MVENGKPSSDMKSTLNYIENVNTKVLSIKYISILEFTKSKLKPSSFQVIPPSHQKTIK